MNIDKLNILGKPYKIFAECIESEALDQFISAMEQDAVMSGALMPDAHKGYSLPIGAVVSVNGAVYPSFVGYDIGCGVCALRLDGIYGEDLMSHREEIFRKIYEAIPTGFNVNTSETAYSLEGLTEVGKGIAKSKKYRHALGSLGGGNHFIEIGEDENEFVWVVIHSGSRGVGHAIATHYMSLASSNPEKLGKAFDERSEAVLKHNPENYQRLRNKYIKDKMGKARPKEGHYSLSTSSEEGKAYIQDLNWALDFALANRSEMMARVVNCITEALDISCYEMDFSELINRNHNHVVEKNGEWIHRKGATHAEEGMMGVIPGNMRDGSFIVRGKGNPDSLYSSSHGAGRVLSRKKAKEILNVDDFEQQMHGISAKVGESTLDESPSAYKNIFEVMSLQESLVEVVAHVTPLINIKS